MRNHMAGVKGGSVGMMCSGLAQLAPEKPPSEG